MLCCACGAAIIQQRRPSTTTCSTMVKKKRPTKKAKRMKNMALLKHTGNEKEKDSPASNIRRRCLSGSCERPDRYQRSLLRKKDKSKSMSNEASTRYSSNKPPCYDGIGIPREVSWELMGGDPMRRSIRELPWDPTVHSREFSRDPTACHGIPWNRDPTVNSREISRDPAACHGIPWNPADLLVAVGSCRNDFLTDTRYLQNRYNYSSKL